MRRAGRALVWAAAFPCRLLPESRMKEGIKVAMLRVHHNIPWRLQVSTGQTAVQVGTPNPRTMFRFSKAVGRTGRVLIVEAEPDNVERLRAALPEAPYRNVTIVHRGAWSEKGRLRLALSPHQADHKFPVPGIVHDNDYRPENTYERSVEVEVDTLDAIVRAAGIDRVDFISVTVNGAEIEVLKGAEALLARAPLRLFVKAHARTADGTPIAEPIVAMLRQRGFVALRTVGEQAVGVNARWTVRDGDVYAFKLEAAR